jgi:hypothetical protein
MRKLLIPLLLASALVPAAAHAQDSGDRRAERAAERESRAQARAERAAAQRAERADRANNDRAARAERAPRPERSVNVERANRVDRDNGSDRPARAERVRRVDRDIDPVQQVQAPTPSQPVQRTAPRRGGLAGGLTDIARDGNDGRRDGDGGWRDRDGDGRRWSGDWRRDRRYDWYNYRNRYRSLYRLGRYYDPYGWGYRRFSIGFSLWPSYYGSNYWLNDPWSYRLPPAYGPYRWVRYYDDALLVNIYSGEVVDVIHNFFW